MDQYVNYSACEEGYQVILHSALFSHECVTTPLQLAAVIIGFSSVICWIFAQAPQVFKSWRSGEADQAFSVFFLIEWAVGDVFNLVGSILSHQLSFQIWQAAYFCTMDVILTAQFAYAHMKRKFKKPTLIDATDAEPVHRRTPTIPVLCMLAVIVPLGFMSTSDGIGNQAAFDQFYKTESLYGGRRLLATGPASGRDDSFNVFLPSVQKDALYGYVLGSISAFFYIVAGFPQAYKNYQRKSCEGLSIFMFVLAALGNLTYALGIFMFSINPMFLLNKLPWLAGSLGSLLYQFTILIQFYLYSEKSMPADAIERSPLNPDYAQPVDYDAYDVGATV